MTLSVNSAWMEAASRDTVAPVFLLTLTDGVSTWKAQSAAHDTMKYAMGVMSVGELAPEIDVMTRGLQVGEVELVVSDAWLRPIFVSNRLFGKKATLKLGFYGLAEASFVNYHIGSVDSILPDGIGKTVQLSLMSALEQARKHMIVGYWVNEHPLDIIYDILINKIGVHADMVDASSLDPDNYTGISHFVVSAVNMTGVTRAFTEPTPGFDVIDGLAQHCNGTLYVNEDGQVSFRIFDATASEAATWTTTDIISLEQTGLDEHMANRCEVAMSPLLGAVQLENSVGFAQEDATSILALAYPGTTERRVTHEINAGWLMGGGAIAVAAVSGVAQEFTASVTTGIYIHGSNSGNFVQSICGTREGHPSASQPANAKISAARPLYLLSDTGEIIKATGLTAFASSNTSYVYTQNPETGAQVQDGPHHDFWELSGVTRGALGTVATAYDNNIGAVIDITIPVYLATAIVDRHSYGISTLEVVTGLRHYDKEPGDLVKITWAPYLDYNHDGIAAGDGKFEILSKEVDASDGTITWGLAWAGSITPSYTYAAAPSRVPGSPVANSMRSMEGEYVVQKHIVEGLGVTHVSGLVVQVAEGIAAAGSLQAQLTATRNLTLTASKDSYIILDLA